MDYSQRRKEQAKHTEQAILQAALELSRLHSFDKVSVRDICQQAGVTTGAFYHHFKTKEDLLNRGFAPLDAYMEQALAPQATGTAGDRLWLILSTYARFIEEQGWELVSRYYQRRLGATGAAPMDPTRFTLRAMVDCLEEIQSQGHFLPEGYTAEWVADFFFRHFRGVVVDWILHRGAYPLLPRLERDYALFRQFFQA